MRFGKKHCQIIAVAAVILVFTVLSGITVYFYTDTRESRIVEERISQYTESIWKYCEEYAVPTELVKSIIKVESKGQPGVVSNKGAVGLMQVTSLAEKDVIEKFRIESGDLLDPEYNIHIGTAYLRILFDRFDNQIYYILAAYHAGPSKVEEWKREMPNEKPAVVIKNHAYKDTKQYIESVLNNK